MSRKNLARQLCLFGLAGLMLASLTPNAFAWGGWRRDLSPRHEVVVVGHDRYHYDDGRFYRPGFFNFGFFISIPPIGAVIRVLPVGHRTIIVGRATYYYYDNVYYTPCPTGYVVVPAPTVAVTAAPAYPVVSPQASSGEAITINVPNTNGSYTPVTLVKRNGGYVGPQGEYYPGNPTIEQLKALYGK